MACIAFLVSTSIAQDNSNAQGDYTISIGGGQPDAGAPGATAHFHVDGQYALPE
jgi:hypothetical protein